LFFNVLTSDKYSTLLHFLFKNGVGKMSKCKNISEYLKVMRITKGERLYDMANNLGLSLSYLSNIENGRKVIPDDFYEKIVSIYGLPEDEADELKTHILHSKRGFLLQPKSPSGKEMVDYLACRMDNFDEKQISLITDFLKSLKK
jgi:transcriptional regulator with XRE-family HTH domain